MKKSRLIQGAALATAILLGTVPCACAQAEPATNAKTAAHETTPAERALALLKPVADKLSAAKAFRFKIESMVEVPAPPGQLINSDSITPAAHEQIPWKEHEQLNGI